MTTEQPSTPPINHEHAELARMLIEISDELYVCTENLRRQDYTALAHAANRIKNTAHTTFAVAINLDRKAKHG